MNEIEKMYKNVGIKEYCSIYETNKQCEGMVDCSECASAKYPPFTTEKQLELIKWLSRYCITIDCEDGEYEVYTVLDDNKIDNFYDKLEDAIAYCVNKIWQDLTPEEKQQVQEILE